MQIPGLALEFAPLPAPVPIWHAPVTFEQWQMAASAVRDAGGRLLALWAGAMVTQGGRGAVPAPACMCAAYVTLEGAFWLSLPLTQQDGRWVYPDLATVFPCAARMQRAAADLSGVVALGAQDTRAWLNHGAWPSDHFPLQQDPHALPLLDVVGVAPDTLAAAAKAAGQDALTTGKNLVKYIVVAIVFGILTAVGLVLCVIPGLIVIFFLQFAPLYALDKGLGVGDAFRSSIDAVKKAPVPVLLAMIVNAVASFVGGWFFGILTLVALPFAALFTVHVYRQLNAEPISE